MPIISIAMQKGGSGKTTTTLSLAAALQLQGKKVLLVDLDPQANLTQSLGVADDMESSIYELLKQVSAEDNLPISDSIVDTAIAPLLPANLELAGAETELLSIYGRENLLQKVLGQVKKEYDFILIDCPPALGILTVNALTASDYVLMPLQAEFLPFKGVQTFMKNIQLIKKQLNKKLEVLGLVLTRYDDHKSMHHSIRKQLEDLYTDKVLQTTIRSNISLARAQELATDIFSFDSHANGAKDYHALTEEILKKISAL